MARDEPPVNPSSTVGDEVQPIAGRPDPLVRTSVKTNLECSLVGDAGTSRQRAAAARFVELSRASTARGDGARRDGCRRWTRDELHER